jgi:hypothetical protein
VPRLILLGAGAAGSSRYAPAGLLLEYGHVRVGFDGGPGSEPPENIHAWLVCDVHSGLQPELRRISHEAAMPEPVVAPYDHPPLHIEPMPLASLVYGYRITTGHRIGVWASVIGEFPSWAAGADLMFADGTDGQVSLGDIAAEAKRLEIRRLVFARLGDAAVLAMDEGKRPRYGEWGEEGRAYRL